MSAFTEHEFVTSAEMQIIWPLWLLKDEVLFKEYVHTYIRTFEIRASSL